MSDSSSGQGPLDVLVIGAGFAGLHMVHKLREQGFAVHGLEKGSGPGGTWYWNRYPGARCDSEIMYYSFSFLPELEQEWPLLERYPEQPVILRYLERVTDVLDLRKDFTFDTRVTGVSYDESENLWTARTEDGGEWRARFVVTAVGCLSAANTPDIPGADTFAGRSLHTGAWPHEPVDLSGQRVGIIGTGASAIQAIPVIAKQAGHLTVFQRTAQFTIPAANGPLDPQFVEMWKQNYPEWRRRARHSMAGVPYTATDVSALEVTPEERRARYEETWRDGGFLFSLGTFNDLLTNEQANDTAADFVRSKIDEIVRDPDVAEKLKPSGYPIATKRLPLDTDYYDTFNRPNVSLVDLRRSPIEEITPEGIRTADGLHELDVIIFATGFDALTGPLSALNITGRGGRSLDDAWAEGPRTYLGLAVPGFPNLLTITGPGSPSVLSNMPVSTEQHAEWIGDCLIHLRDNGIDRIEATADATEAWTEHVQEVAAGTLYPRAASWYMGANIPGKPRLFLPYVGGVGVYREKCDQVAADGYTGFELAASGALV
ncbi:flavin-containing monooxygenase [Pseudonocardia endophytica]|uniref:Cyclohexanone monooxygenase n=1 Tax=Pseudonocardia endophytica TaxID=401976 RepID=A0A4R1HIA1_PSEEN|nr:NAD(P)/FAD-dependent oxidoreductase [Pseudonocardia endophytica]TCK22004.1 cyclohexanone monooxygenase [Pseudonocardia endophytica]